MNRVEQAKLSSRIKVLNERYKEIVKAFGYSSRQANEWRVIMSMGETHVSKSGFEALRNVKGQSLRVIEKLEKKETAGERKVKLFKDAMSYYSEEERKQWSKSDIIRAYSELQDEIHVVVERYKDAIYRMSAEMTSALKRGWNEKLTTGEVRKLFELVEQIERGELDNIPKEKQIENLERGKLANDVNLSELEKLGIW